MTTGTLEEPRVVITAVPRSPEDAMLALLADAVDDIERIRIATMNRHNQLTRIGVDKDGEERGFGLDERHPAVARMMAIIEQINVIEDLSTRALQAAMKEHPLGPWVKKMRGVGEKQAARLLAATGDPYWHPLKDRPRLVSELWSFCGYGVWRLDPGTHELLPAGAVPQGDLGIAPHRRRGVRSNWNDSAKMRTYLVMVACLKQLEKECKELGENRHLPGCKCSPYRKVYDEGRVKYAGAVHRSVCKRCGPSGSPAQIGSPLSAGHQHMRAMRLGSKAILLDLWLAAKEAHEAKEAPDGAA